MLLISGCQNLHEVPINSSVPSRTVKYSGIMLPVIIPANTLNGVYVTETTKFPCQLCYFYKGLPPNL